MERPVEGPHMGDGTTSGTTKGTSPNSLSPLQTVRDRAHTWTMEVASRRSPILPDAEEMKAKVLENLTRTIYNVHDLYHYQGVCQTIARNHWFEHITFLVIVINAIYLGVESDHNSAISVSKASAVFQVFENAFCIFFITELLIRFLAFKRKRNCLLDAWFVFDLVLVIVMVIETWILGYVLPWNGINLEVEVLGNSDILRLVRILRLSRLSRLARLLQSVPELVILLKGLAMAMPAAGWTATLLFIAMYIWALVLKQIAYGTDFEKDFPDIPNAMFTLMITGCFKKGFDGILREMKEKDSAGVFIVYFLFVLFSGVTIMKMLTGMLVKVINAVATRETEHNHVILVRDELLQVMVEMGYSDEKDIHAIRVSELKVSEEMFGQMLLHPRALKAFKEIGIDVAELPSFLDFVFPPNAGEDGCESSIVSDDAGEMIRADSTHSVISFATFMKQILKLKSSNTATVKDAVHLRKFIRAEVKGMEDSMIELHKSLHAEIQEMRRNLFQSIPGLSEQRAKRVEVAQDAKRNGYHKEIPFMATMSATQSEEFPIVVAMSDTAETVFHSLCSLSVEDSRMQQTDHVASPGKWDLCSNVLEELVIQDVVNATGSGLAVGRRARATVDIDYKDSMRVPKGTVGTVIAQEPKLLIDWDCFTTLDYMRCMLDCAKACTDQVETIKVPPLDLKPGMHVVVTGEFKNQPEIAHLKGGQQGLVLEIDDGGNAWIDFFSSGRHRVPRQSLAHLKFQAQRSRFLRLLASSHSRSGHHSLSELVTFSC